MAECCNSEENSVGTAKKWACTYCTYLNWEASSKCVLCLQQRNKPMIIEELCPTSDSDNIKKHLPIYSDLPSSAFTDEQQQLNSDTIEEVRWSCTTCTYLNCRRTKRCIQCNTDRPIQYLTPPSSSPTAQQTSSQIPHNLQESQQLISRALNKWSCSICTYDNWPTALKCTICGQSRQIGREQSNSPPQLHNCNVPQQKKKFSGKTSQLLRQDSTDTNFNRLRINDDSSATVPTQPSVIGKIRSNYTSALDIYMRRFLANDPVEKLFFNALSAIGRRELQMVNQVVDYLINEGNIQRTLNTFETRLMNQYVQRDGQCRVVGFENADSLYHLAKKSDSLDLVKLIRRVRLEEDRLPCALNCTARTRLYAKVTACMAARDGSLRNNGGCAVDGSHFKCQFITHPHNFGIFQMNMPGSDLALAVQNAIFRPAPSIPPRLCYVECFDAMASKGGLIVGRPPNFLMRNRGGANSLYDSVFQCMFGVCDRFNILKTATKFTIHRSAHLLKVRWLEQQLRMVRDCGLQVNSDELNADWDEIVNSIGQTDECPEPIHIWVLAHVCCRPIIVYPMDDPVDVDQLHADSANEDYPISSSDNHPTASGGISQQEIYEKQLPKNMDKLPPRQSHHYEGIYLPNLCAPSVSVSRSPLIICYRNGLFHAVIVSDALYPRDNEVQRYLRIHRSIRSPGSGNDSLFRYCTRSELDNSTRFLSQFLLLGKCTAQQLNIRREPYPHLPESLYFYRNWMQALLQLASDENIPIGTATPSQIENRMADIAFVHQQHYHQNQQKKRKGGSAGMINVYNNQQQSAIVSELLTPSAIGVLFNNHSDQQQLLLHPNTSPNEHDNFDVTPGICRGDTSPKN